MRGKSHDRTVNLCKYSTTHKGAAITDAGYDASTLLPSKQSNTAEAHCESAGTHGPQQQAQHRQGRRGNSGSKKSEAGPKRRKRYGAEYYRPNISDLISHTSKNDRANNTADRDEHEVEAGCRGIQFQRLRKISGPPEALEG